MPFNTNEPKRRYNDFLSHLKLTERETNLLTINKYFIPSYWVLHFDVAVMNSEPSHRERNDIKTLCLSLQSESAMDLLTDGLPQHIIDKYCTT